MLYENLKCLLTVAKRGGKKNQNQQKAAFCNNYSRYKHCTKTSLICEVHTNFHENDKRNHSNTKKIFPSKLFVEPTRDPQQFFLFGSLALVIRHYKCDTNTQNAKEK